MRTGTILIGFLLASTIACGDDDSQGPAEPATGEYTAVVFTSTVGGFTTDHIFEGAAVTLSLLEGGTTAGHAFVPGGDEGGGDLDLDLAGTWDQNGNEVTLDLDGDFFIEDVVFVHDDGLLSADETFQGVRIRITLADGSAG